MTAGRVVLASTYELGHQPIGLAAPAAALRARGHRVECVDLAVEPFDAGRFAGASLIGISVPMHTAARLGVALARRLRGVAPDAHLCFYGLYAPLLHERLGNAGLADSMVGGEYEPALCDLADRIVGGTLDAVCPPAGTGPASRFDRQRYPVPDRDGLPPLERYAQLDTGRSLELAGYVEASRGCAHHCQHCPLTPAYGGRLRLVQPEVVLADIDQLVELGARHITFGDPDFLNAVPHSMAIVEELHSRHPSATFDATIKVEHLLEHESLLPRLRHLGCLFVTSAFESCNDELLRLLDKGHSRADLERLMRIAAAEGLTVRPTWLPFTPWGSVQDFIDLLDFIERQRLTGTVPPVQYGLRLLLPPGSPLVPVIDADGLLDGFDDELLSYVWHGRDARVDALQREVATIAEAAADATANLHDIDGPEHRSNVFAQVKRAALVAAHGERAPAVDPPPPQPVAPGLTEAWFC